MTGKARLAGQKVVVIGGSSGIGLETARRVREAGAELILTARDPDRLRRVGLELGASTAAFDVNDGDRLMRFFADLPGPVRPPARIGERSSIRSLPRAGRRHDPSGRRADSAVGPDCAPSASRVATSRKPLVDRWHQRQASVSRASYLCGHRRDAGASSEPRLRASTSSSQSACARICRYATFRGNSGKGAGRSARAAPCEPANSARRASRGRCRVGPRHNGEHRRHRGDLRRRRRPAAGRRLSPTRQSAFSGLMRRSHARVPLM